MVASFVRGGVLDWRRPAFLILAVGRQLCPGFYNALAKDGCLYGFYKYKTIVFLNLYVVVSWTGGDERS